MGQEKKAKKAKDPNNGTIRLEGHTCAIQVGGKETLRGAVYNIMRKKKSMELQSLIKAAIERKPPVSKRPEFVYHSVIKGWVHDGIMAKETVNDDTVVVLKE